MIALIDYGAGNLASVANVLTKLSTNFVITQNSNEIDNSDKIILPGVGEASSAMNKLSELNLINVLKTTSKPLLGICLGMQLFCEFSEESNTSCLGIFATKSISFNNKFVKVPQIGWNQITVINNSLLFNEINDNDYFYFANSYYVPINNYTVASSNYGIDFSAAIQKDNFYGVQFHPEKSGKLGLKILNNFVTLC